MDSPRIPPRAIERPVLTMNEDGMEQRVVEHPWHGCAGDGGGSRRQHPATRASRMSGSVATAPIIVHDRGVSAMFSSVERIPARDRSFDLVIAHGIWNLARSARGHRPAVTWIRMRRRFMDWRHVLP